MWLIERGLLDIEKSAVIGYVAETGCQYFSLLAYLDTLTAALHRGNDFKRSNRHLLSGCSGRAWTCLAEQSSR